MLPLIWTAITAGRCHWSLADLQRRTPRLFHLDSPMKPRSPQPLDYASPHRRSARHELHKLALNGCVVLGVAANAWFAYVGVAAVFHARTAYQSLSRDPRSFSREIAPATIASLQHPFALWLAAAALVLAAMLGVFLASLLLSASRRSDRCPEQAAVFAESYRFWKPIAAGITGVAIYWFLTEQSSFWEAATRHTPIGRHSPAIESALVAACALVPWWLLGRRRVTTESLYSADT